MDKLFLLDAYALIYRSYYAFIKNPRINSKGINTSAIIGFVNTLQEVIEKEQPKYLGVAFDPHGPTFRSDAYPEYKAQREKTPEDITRAVPIIKELLGAYRIPVIQVDGYEADDVIGTLAKKAESIEGVETYMLTPDKDYGQLVSERTHIYRPRHGGGYEVMGPKEVCEKYGITTPPQVIDLLALMGDSADTFPGCPGVGEKTAAKLIADFGNVDNLINRTDELKGALKKKVEEHVEDIRMSYFLATIKTDVPVDLDLEALTMTSPDEDALTKIFNELEFKTLLNKVLGIQAENKPKNTVQQLDLFAEINNEGGGEVKNDSFETLQTTPHNYKLIENKEDAEKLRDFFITTKKISLDTETTSTNPIDAELVGLSFSIKEKEAFYVAIPENFDEAKKIVEIFKPIYENPDILKIGQNIKYDYVVLKKYGVTIQGEMWDTMIAHYVLQPELRHNMDYMAEVMLGYKTIHIDELIGPKERGKKQGSMRDLSPQQVYEYACEDADVTMRLKNALEPKLHEAGLYSLFCDIEMPLVPV